MDKQELIALASAIEKLEGPCRETDALVHRAVYPDQLIMTDAGGYKGERPVRHTPIGALEWNNWADIADLIQAPRYTASIDAAMTLVPTGHTVQLSDWEHEQLREQGAWQAIVLPRGARGGMTDYTFSNRCDHASTPALALCAASLRAIASQEGK